MRSYFAILGLVLGVSSLIYTGSIFIDKLNNEKLNQITKENRVMKSRITRIEMIEKCLKDSGLVKEEKR